MTQAAEIEDDLSRILALTKAALSARDDAASWRRSPEKAVGHHAACCDALWVELERLVDLSDGKVETLEHPAMRQRRIARRLRAHIVGEAIEAISERLEQVSDHGLAWEEPGALTAEEYADMLT